MKQRPDAGLDEPTIISRRPIGPTRGGGPRRPTRAASGPEEWRAPDPVPLLPAGDDRSEPRGTGSRAVAEASLNVPVPEQPKHEGDVLSAAATPLLVVVAQLRGAVQHADVSALRKEMVDQIRRFEERAIRFGASAPDVSAARYALCSLIDESVMTTPWGSASDWSTRSLLLEFHSETWGGEKVFTILEQLRGNPQKHYALLKLFGLCLLLGFEGKFRVIDNGREQLADIRLEIARLLRQFGKPAVRELSPVWRGVEHARKLRQFVPLWAIFAVTLALILGSYAVIKIKISGEVDPVVHELDTVGRS